MTVKDHLPFSTPEREGFQHIAKTAIPLWKPPFRDTLTRLSELKYTTIKDVVCKNISELPSMCLTFDTWTETHQGLLTLYFSCR